MKSRFRAARNTNLLSCFLRAALIAFIIVEITYFFISFYTVFPVFSGWFSAFHSFGFWDNLIGLLPFHLL